MKITTLQAALDWHNKEASELHLKPDGIIFKIKKRGLAHLKDKNNFAGANSAFTSSLVRLCYHTH